eukprot:scaffold27662_cov154-Skeletonema_menzelii.AAC.4
MQQKHLITDGCMQGGEYRELTCVCPAFISVADIGTGRFGCPPLPVIHCMGVGMSRRPWNKR